MGFSSLASALLVHVFKTHKLEHRMTRDFYARRIFPLGFLMVRARAAALAPAGRCPLACTLSTAAHAAALRPPRAVC
jgi:hypothetical protein